MNRDSRNRESRKEHTPRHEEKKDNRSQNRSFHPYHENTSSSSTKNSASSSFGNRGRGSYSSLEARVAGGSDCLCPGSHISSFWQVWETRDAHPRVVIILKEGYCLNFRFQPPLTNYPAVRSKYLNREK